MAIYIVLAVPLVLCAAFEIFYKLKLSDFRSARIIAEILLIAEVIAMTFISGFRLSTGYDYHAYARIFIGTFFKSIENITTRHEKGYTLINLFAGYLSIRLEILFVLVALIISVLLYTALKKMSPYPMLGLLLFYLFGYYFNSMNFMRNMISAMIILLAYTYLRDTRKTKPESGQNLSRELTRSFIRYAVLVIAASTFHRSAILMLPVWLILNIKFNIITLPAYAVISGVIIYFATPLMQFITTYFYTDYDPLTSRQMMGSIPSIYSLCLGLVFIIAFLWRKKFYGTKWGTILVSASYFAFFFGYLGSRHSVLGRFSLYFGPVTVIILIPELINQLILIINSPKANKKPEANSELSGKIIASFNKKINFKKISAILSFVGLGAAAVTFFVYAITHNYNGVVPHDWIWNHVWTT